MNASARFRFVRVQNRSEDVDVVDELDFRQDLAHAMLGKLFDIES